MAVVISALFATLMVGHFLFRMHPGDSPRSVRGCLHGDASSCGSSGGGEKQVPTLGYGVSYAVGNVLLALWGKVIVFLLV